MPDHVATNPLDDNELRSRADLQARFDRSWRWEQQRVRLRFGSINYLADVWLNGSKLGQHEGGHSPFEVDISDLLRAEGHHLIVRVDGETAPDRVPPGNIAQHPLDTFVTVNYPATSFDFLPFCGIQRPVLLYWRRKA